MMPVEAIAWKWHYRLLSTEPVDHGRADGAVAEVYRQGGLNPPEKALWCASPLEAMWSVLMLIGRGESYNIPLLDDLGRTNDGPDKLAKARQSVAERLGISPDQVEGHFGQPFYQADKKLLLMTVMQERWMTIAAAAMAGKGWQVGDRGPFEALDSLEKALHLEGNDGGILQQAVAKAGAKQIKYLAIRSAHHRLYGNFAYGEIARDQALAELAEGEISDLMRALWTTYEACGMWWPMTGGVVFAERPISAERSKGGVRLEWSDGFGLEVAAAADS